MKITAGSKLVLIGDSITDAGRDASGEPTPWNHAAGLGSGYVSLVHALLQTFCPQQRIRIINRGISGHTILDLAARWQSDVLDLQPDWLSVMIGINDVWRQFDCPLGTEKHVLPVDYEKTYRQLLVKTRPQLKGLILMTPYVIEANPADPMRCQMRVYAEIVRGLAQEFDALFVDTQVALDRLMESIPPTGIAWDRIHPDRTGHMVLARAFLDAIGFDWH